MAGDNIPMTKAGADAIKREIKRLKAVERPRIVHEISVARDHGDLSENAEYHAAKERQSHIEGRIQMLEDRLVPSLDFADAPDTGAGTADTPGKAGSQEAKPPEPAQPSANDGARPSTRVTRTPSGSLGRITIFWRRWPPLTRVRR